MRTRLKRLSSFTLIELLTVMALIAILAGVVISAALGVMAKALRSRAASEIQAISTALEGYKTDNGIYPPSDGNLLTNNYVNTDPTKLGAGGGDTNGIILYTALSGQVNSTTPPTAGTKSYMQFKRNQVGDDGSFSYVKDPWGASYLYSTGDNKNPESSTPYNGSGFFDLFSTGGIPFSKYSSPNSTLTNAWISNWQ
jgi:prepilin-type N-terminal cleavage/methylation domain-containing protein